MVDRFVPRPDGVNSPRLAWEGSARNGVCPACKLEMHDPRSRRFRYPFICCPQCGPGYTITMRLPFARLNTTMAPFEPCDRCLEEFEDPASRHFGSATICCPDCGPSYWIEPSPPLDDHADVVTEVARLLESGAILALKDTCSFRLMARADHSELVERLRRRVDLPGTPLGVMVHDIDEARKLAEVSDEAAAQLSWPSAPLVVLPRRSDALLAWEVTAGAEEIAVMLPRSPMHFLVLEEFGAPAVVTRAGRGDDVPVLENEDAREELSDVADHLVLHDLGLHSGCEDSKIRLEADGPVVLRRAAGYAPRPIRLAAKIPATLGIGGRHDVTVAIGHESTAYLSQPVGHLFTQRSEKAFDLVLERMLSLWSCRPERVAHDPTRAADARVLAERFGAVTVEVDHHHAHLASVLVETGCECGVVGVSLDASGPILHSDLGSARLIEVSDTVATELDRLPGFRVPGADAAPRDPWRSAVGLLHDLLDPGIARYWARQLAPEEQTATAALSMLESGAGCTRIQSFGRLYDAAAAVLGLARRTSSQSEAAARLELAAGRLGDDPIDFTDVDPIAGEPRAQLASWVAELVRRAESERDVSISARWVQVSLARWMAQWAGRSARALDRGTIVGAGGSFTNPWLRHHFRRAAEEQGFLVLLNRSVPAGDGGLALGQVWAAGRRSLVRENS